MKRAGKKRRLPIGIQTFREIRKGGFYYVDKTAFAERLIEEGKHYFLSRPRRFGKSLFLDTLKELFEGNERLFRGLHIHDHWDWSVRRPVIRFDFGSGGLRSEEGLYRETMAQLQAIEAAAGIEGQDDLASVRFRELLRTLHERSGQRVVVLVDEYDRPIVNTLNAPDTARANQDFLRGVFSNVKSGDADIAFSFFTGVSKFTKVSLFSDLNNLIDITLDPPFSSICGYTEEDLDTVFAPELGGLDREAIRDWYNGYNWLGEERVYNPFGLLLFFRRQEFRPWWFESGSPSFLVRTLKERRIRSFDLDRMWSDEALLSKFHVGQIAPEALLFQTGYLTIREGRTRGMRTHYRLGYPNREIRVSLNVSLLDAMTPPNAGRTAPTFAVVDRLAAGDFAGLERHFRALFSAIPYEWHTRNEIARYEGYYASVFYSHVAAAGLDVVVEDSTSRGRVDLTVRYGGRVYLFEFKVVEDAPEGTAIEQLRRAGYADKYRCGDRPVTLIGVEFSKKARNLAAFTVETA